MAWRVQSPRLGAPEEISGPWILMEPVQSGRSAWGVPLSTPRAIAGRGPAETGEALGVSSAEQSPALGDGFCFASATARNPPGSLNPGQAGACGRAPLTSWAGPSTPPGTCTRVPQQLSGSKDPAPGS